MMVRLDFGGINMPTLRERYRHWLPREDKCIWLLFDTANGHKPSHRYVWWFESRAKAISFQKEQNTRYRNTTKGYYVVGPFKFKPAK